MKFKLRESDEVNSAIEIMSNNFNNQDEAYVGPFWYDINNKELFGQVLTPANDIPFYHSNQFNIDIKTGNKLHQDIWKKQVYRNKDSRFSGDYTKIPRGRVFEFKNSGFKVLVGNWVNDYPEAKQEIIDEFQLPDSTEFIIDSHWDIGHGWSNEF